MDVVRVKVTKDDEGKFRYSAQASNNQVVEESEQGFEHLQYAIERAHDRYPDAQVRVKYGAMNYVVDFSAESEGE